MPSSSTGTTHAEQTLTSHFRKALVLLRLAARPEELSYFVESFVELVDLDASRLRRALFPRTLPTARQRADAGEEIQALERLREESGNLGLGERFGEAGDSCADMGWLLIGVGRRGEGEMWCGFERLLKEAAWRVGEEERARRACVEVEEERWVRAVRGRGQPGVQVLRREVAQVD